MPDMQMNDPSSAGIPPAAMNAAAQDDFDYALGCECADPSLQIERWGFEAPTAGEPN